MQSIFKAVADLLAALFYGYYNLKSIIKKPQEAPPTGYRSLYFNCWLCQGKNNFACKLEIKKKKFTTECKWCGVDNYVTVDVSEK